MGENSIGSGRITTFADAAAVAEGVADWMLALAQAKQGTFTVCLSGGSTPKTLYQRLAQPPYREAFPWDRTAWFFGDERFVPAGDPASNYTMACEALFNHVPVPERAVHRMETDTASAEVTAAAYERMLRSFYAADVLDPARPLFDVNLLGLGPDGHTASLLPGQPVLEERSRWVAAVAEGRPEARITLTYPVLESSRSVAFLVVGAEKRTVLAHVRSGARDVPAARLATAGEVHVFTDAAAVSAG